jgi:hypothetical protein
MKWVLAATFLLAAIATPGAAQMRGMRSSAPARSFARPSMGFARPIGARPNSRPVFRPSAPIRSFRGQAFSRGRASTFGFGNRRVFFGNHQRPFFPRHHRIFISTFPFGSPFFGGYGGYYDPFLWDYPSSYGTADTSSYQQSSSNYDYDRLNDQVGQLNSQVGMLRDENDSLRSEMERRAQPVREERSSAPEPPTVLVFRDGHRTETQNYAIVGQTLWILTGNRATKVPLADLDLNQTTKINEDRGVSFLAGKPES